MLLLGDIELIMLCPEQLNKLLKLRDVALDDLDGALSAVMKLRSIFIDLQATIAWLQSVFGVGLAIVRTPDIIYLGSLNKRFSSHRKPPSRQLPPDPKSSR